jgi:hypothetical protein
MRLNRTLRFGFAMLLALMLPLQGYAAMPACAQHDQANSGVAGMTASPTAHQHCERGTTAGDHHDGNSHRGNGHCDNCCCGVAIAATSARWIAPLLSAPEISHVILWFPPAVTLDRLDRPPRYTPA